jgi:hypothetical protein
VQDELTCTERGERLGLADGSQARHRLQQQRDDDDGVMMISMMMMMILT